MTPGSESAPQLDADRCSLTPAGGAALMVGATLAAANLFPADQVPARLIVVAVAVGTCAAVLADTRVSLAVAGLGYLLFTGFLVNSYGELTWDGWNSVGHLLVFGMATAIGLGQRWLRTVQADVAFDTALQQLLNGADADDDGRRPPE